MQILETERLAVRPFTADDAAFALELLNDPSFLRYVGDKGVRTLDDARAYIVGGPLDSYQRNGFGLLVVEVTATRVPIGMCGLLKRPALDDVDIGFAFLPQYRSMGFAYESASRVMLHAREDLAIERVVAIANPENGHSVRLLAKLGLRFDRMIRLADDAPEVGLYAP